ncbi:TPA: glycosyltransferase family 4 protein [Vibrio cholerae]|uniref:glycosyltransferase family 4 protein n=1 Tax=Vibrio cholerae TaxID=666 RepID=UPI0011DA67E8|nr:glycosyltransferase family 4 protein [Vibrio cholerae]QKU64098.1 glycosyltransferase family 4 protein [Vibrio cholerae]QKU67981.1 glycosyltransferase family 4 protein [Vibrio cholerae]TXX50711.1 glycosyltransferase family 4 protein [Vibrio cholerae]
MSDLFLKGPSFLLFNHSSVYGGQERYAESIIRGLRRNDYYCIFTGSGIRHYDNYGHKPHQEGIATIILNGNSALYRSLRFKKSGCSFVYVQHSDINDNQGPIWKRLIRKILVKILLQRVDLVVRVCDQALPENYAKGKVVTIYNGVSLPTLIPRPNYHQKLLMVGALTINKNHCLAIRSLSLLPDATLTIVGDGPERKNLERLTHELGVAERVSFEGFVSDPSRYYQTHDLLLMLSFYEAFPYVVLEAMAAKCPVVSVKVGGVPEAITDGKDGWLLSGYSHTELADRVDAISRDSEAYAAISCAARNTIEKRFTEDHMVEQLLNEISKRSLVK